MLRKQRKLQPWRRFGYVILIIIKSGELLLWFSPRIINGLRSYIKHSKGCFIRYPNTLKLVKKTRLRLVFSITSRCLDIGWNTLPRVWYITSSPFECRITIVKYCDRFQPAWKWDQILWIDVYLQIVACKLKNLSDFTPDINFSSSEAERAFEVW